MYWDETKCRMVQNTCERKFSLNVSVSLYGLHVYKKLLPDSCWYHKVLLMIVLYHFVLGTKKFGIVWVSMALGFQRYKQGSENGWPFFEDRTFCRLLIAVPLNMYSKFVWPKWIWLAKCWNWSENDQHLFLALVFFTYKASKWQLDVALEA